MLLTPEEGRRLHVLSLLERGRFTTRTAANAFVATTLLPAVAASACRPVPRGCDLVRVCAVHYARRWPWTTRCGSRT